MTFNILISRNVFFDQNDKIRNEIHELFDSIQGREIQLVLVTRNKLKYKKIIDESFSENHGIKFGNRADLSRKFTSNNKGLLILGAVKEDIWIAANNQILLINPQWVSGVAEEIETYGFKLQNYLQVLECIDILNIETQLFYNFAIDENTRLIAVSNANKYYTVKKEEEMIHTYRGILKFGVENYKYAVYFHYLTMIIGTEYFKDVDYWMTVPSSDGTNKNNIYEIVKHTRYLLKNNKKDELFIRHTPAKKSTSMSRDERISIGCKRHLDTLILNPKYKGKLKGKKICVLDDYVTNGTSFESIRNMLKHEEVSEIILIAIGTFKQPYQKEDYKLTGDLYKPGFDYSFVGSDILRGTANDKSLEVIELIHDIIKK